MHTAGAMVARRTEGPQQVKLEPTRWIGTAIGAPGGLQLQGSRTLKRMLNCGGFLGDGGAGGQASGGARRAAEPAPTNIRMQEAKRRLSER